MCEQTEVNYLDGEVVWVKLGSIWWPGEVVGPDKLPADLSFRKPPIAVVKFYQEDTFEYVKNKNYIDKYNCSRKEEFIKKGVDLFRANRTTYQHAHMEKFPKDVITAESATGGDTDILSREEFQEVKKESYAGLFGDPTKTPTSGKRGRNFKQADREITPFRKSKKGNADYKVHILLQGSKTCLNESTDLNSTPSTSKMEEVEPAETTEVENATIETPSKLISTTPITSTSSGVYACHACAFSTSRLNIMILHNKSHSVTFTPYIPSPVVHKQLSPIPSPKSTVKSTPINTPKIVENTSKTPSRKARRERSSSNKKNIKRSAEDKPMVTVKRTKTDEEIKTTLLADWDDECADDNEEEAVTTPVSPEVPIASQSPAVPTSTITESKTSVDAVDTSLSANKKTAELPLIDKPETSSDSRYEFCEDEDWPLEADLGRKIPRVKNSSKQKHDVQIRSIDDEDVAREVAELLDKTTVPDLPAAPEPLTVEENFPEPSVVKSPDKPYNQLNESGKSSKTVPEEIPTKTIFKTKTFFRSRHSRSQDAIEKYVAEQLNATEKIDSLDSEINGSPSSPETRDSPPMEPIKVARLAPKIQLKKMKAEAAQLKEIYNLDASIDIKDSDNAVNYSKEHEKEISITNNDENNVKSNLENNLENNEDCDILAQNENQMVGIKNSDLPVLNENTKEITETNDSLKNENEREVSKESDLPVYNLTQPEQSQDQVSVQNEHEVEIEDKSLPLDSNKIPIVDCATADYNKNNVSSKLDQLTDILPDPDLLKELNNDFHKNDIAHESGNIDKLNLGVEYKTGDCSMSIDNSVNQDELQNVSENELNYEQSASNKKELNIEKSASNKNDLNIEQSASKKIELNIEQTASNKNELNIEQYACNKNELDIKQSAFNNNDLNIEQAASNKNDLNIEQAASFKIELNVEQAASNEIELNVDQTASNESVSATTIALIGDAFSSATSDTDSVANAISNDLPEELLVDDIKSDCLHSDSNVKSVASLNGKACFDVSNNTHKEERLNKNDEERTTSFVDNLMSNNNAIDKEHSNTVSTEIVSSQNNSISFLDNVPSESDLQIAEALINLPSTHNQSNIVQSKNGNAIQHISENHVIKMVNKSDEKPIKKLTSIILQKSDIIISKNGNTISNEVKCDDTKSTPNTSKECLETEDEKSKNLHAAQSLVQMSETLDHTIANTTEYNDANNSNAMKQIETSLKYPNVIVGNISAEQKPSISSTTKSTIKSPTKPGSSKLLQILEEPSVYKGLVTKTPTKSIIIPKKEKIINFQEVNKIPGKNTSQKVIIRKTPNKNVINNLNESPQEKIVLSRTKSPQDGSTVQTYTIQASPDTLSDTNTIFIQQKLKKLTKPPKLQKIKPPPTTLLATKPGITLTNNVTTDEGLFDINSMPVVLSDDIVTPENIEKMPIVMSDGNIITKSSKTIKSKQVIKEVEKVTSTLTSVTGATSVTNKAEIKTLVMHPAQEVNKSTTPNILSKSTKLRGAKPMLIIDKSTGKQKIIMAKPEIPVKEIKQVPAKSSTSRPTTGKSEKLIILPANNAPRPTRTQKIVIDPHTGKAHVITSKSDSMTDTKPVSAKLISSASEPGTPGGTVMIITNAQGAQSRIVLTPEHEKILFPKKQQSIVTQLKPVVPQRQISNVTGLQKIKTQTIISTTPQQPVITKSQTKIITKQKSAIITSKGQLIVSGRLAPSTTQSIATMPEIRPAPPPKRIMPSELKSIQPIQKTAPGEPLIFLQQKSGTIMQLTTAQFEHLQRTGQIIQKSVNPETKNVIQKLVTVKPNEQIVPFIQKQRSRVTKLPMDSPTPAKKSRHEINIAPAPPPLSLTACKHPGLSPLSTSSSTTVQSLIIPQAVQMPATTSYPDLENFEELLPSTAIARQPEPPAQAEPPPPPQPEPTTSLSDGQLLAVPGEHFGGPAGSFYLCVGDKGTLTPIDNRPLVLENNELVPMAIEPTPVLAAQPERRDILEAALANSDVFHAEPPREEAPAFRDLNANVSVHCRVSETSSTLNQPIMTPVEVPTKGESEPAVPSSLEDGLAVIGVTPHTVPTSLELPITVTDPRIAPKTTDPLSNTSFGTTLLQSPNTEMMFVDTEEVVSTGPISMPLLTDEDDGIGKSMPILTDEGNERTASSVDSTVDSPSSIEVRESEIEEGSNWSRRLLTPGSDSSETSAEIPLQPAIQVSVNDLNRRS